MSFSDPHYTHTHTHTHTHALLWSLHSLIPRTIDDSGYSWQADRASWSTSGSRSATLSTLNRVDSYKGRLSSVWEKSSFPKRSLGLAWSLWSPCSPSSVLIPFLPKLDFLGHELFIASPKPFPVCFLFKYCISHQKVFQAISKSLPDLSNREQGC